MMGHSDRGRLLVVVFTEREERIRIIKRTGGNPTRAT